MNFEKKYLKSGPDQTAYVTSDLARAMEVFSKQFGIPRFFQMKGFTFPNQKFQVQSAPLVLDVALAWTGTVFLEILQPLERDVLYGSHIKPEGFTLAFHHTAFAVKNWDQFLSDFETEGRTLLFSGETEGLIQSGYWDARDVIGHYVEFYSNAPAAEATWEMIKTGNF